jgi:hypothetical protein
LNIIEISHNKISLKAGLLTSKLTIALEPEAASIFCRHLSVDTTISGGNISIAKMPVGTRYMVLDAGGMVINVNIDRNIRSRQFTINAFYPVFLH